MCVFSRHVVNIGGSLYFFFLSLYEGIIKVCPMWSHVTTTTSLNFLQPKGHCLMLGLILNNIFRQEFHISCHFSKCIYQQFASSLCIEFCLLKGSLLMRHWRLSALLPTWMPIWLGNQRKMRFLFFHIINSIQQQLINQSFSYFRN